MQQKGWEFKGKNGEFVLENPTMNNYLYFPLVNEKGMMSVVSPTLHGDINTSQNSFLSEPMSAIDLHNSKVSRNFWLLVDDKAPISLTGQSAKQEAEKFDKNENVKLKAGMLYHKIIRNLNEVDLKTEITNFVPVTNDQVEIMEVKIKNKGSNTRKIDAISAIPLYGRSADNLRDHRHVTSLLNVTKTVENGVELTPTLSFDERGHKENDLTYAVYGKTDNCKSPIGFYPVFEDFIGEGGSLTWPKSLVQNEECIKKGKTIEGYESMGALRFETINLKPSEQKTYYLAIVVKQKDDNTNYSKKYCEKEKVDKYLKDNKEYWKNLIDKVKFKSSDSDFDKWMKWVTIQPTLRRLFGNSFLPHHDYGRGGRGWRDLWQDALALLLMEPKPVRDMLYNSFAGVRVDGSNATIIGSKPGEFIADRNGISRTWMDHGAWPFLTTKLYIDRSGDLDFLLEKQTYFKDALLNRSNEFDENWSQDQGNLLKTKDEKVYKGTLLEHILVQHLSIFFNVGKHNNLKLEGGDWNDGLDMAEDKGESVPFTALYASNMLELAKLLKKLKKNLKIDSVKVFKEILVLLDTLDKKVDYKSVNDKNKRLDKYFDLVKDGISGQIVNLKIDDLIIDLEKKGKFIVNHIRENEWIKSKEDFEWFNAYYDNDGKRLEGDHNKGTRMTLTGQVFTIMGNVATDNQVQKISKACDHYLKDETIGGYRLNTPLNEVKLNLGRAFGFAYGEKENGAMFSHMDIMYSNALYQRNFSKKAYKVIDMIYKHCKNFEKSKIFPGVPEYIDSRGRGLYHFLTGSASWLLLTMVNEVYGIKGEIGNLKLEPKLVLSQFDKEKKASIETIFADRKIKFVYINQNLKEADEYKIDSLLVNKKPVEFRKDGKAILVDRKIITDLDDKNVNEIEIKLV
ncbi:MAG: GH36-type glycosyl hydrolase domain-containing protein [Bacillota bacterium]